jgi:hypothetical protein
MILREYLSLPYTLVVDAVEHSEISWIRKATYLELPECVVETMLPLEAIEELEKLKVRIIIGKLLNGESVPIPGEPLNSSDQAFELKRLGFSQWIGFLDYDENDMLMQA